MLEILAAALVKIFGTSFVQSVLQASKNREQTVDKVLKILAFGDSNLFLRFPTQEDEIEMRVIAYKLEDSHPKTSEDIIKLLFNWRFKIYLESKGPAYKDLLDKITKTINEISVRLRKSIVKI